MYGPCGCGDKTRTCDLRVMSPTSYQLLYPAIFVLLTFECFIIISKITIMSIPFCDFSNKTIINIKHKTKTGSKVSAFNYPSSLFNKTISFALHSCCVQHEVPLPDTNRLRSHLYYNISSFLSIDFVRFCKN